VIALDCITVYTLLVGAGASVVRAALMGGLTLLAAQLGRRQVCLNTLGFVGVLMALYNPYVLWDVGIQLSFAATLGLVLYAEPLTNAFLKLADRRLPPESAQKLRRPVGEYLLFTFAATLTTLPVIAYHFQRLSLVSLLANPFILPAQPPLMILGGMSSLLWLVSLPLGKGVTLIAWIFAAYSVRLAEFFAAFPGSVLTLVRVSLGWVALFYGALFGLTFFGGQARTWLAARSGGKRWATLPWLALAGIGIAAVLVWRVALIAPDGKLHMTVLDVGSGDGILIQTPSGRYLLVDGGPSSTQLADALGRRLSAGQHLDWLLVAAPGEEQVGSLPPLIERSPPGQVLWAGAPSGTQAARRLQEQLNQSGIRPVTLQTGHSLDLGEGAWLRTLAVGPRGAVLLLEWSHFRALLPVGIDFEMLEDLQIDPSLNQVTALLLADSRYAPANPPGWIEKLRPQVALLSVAAGDREGRPSPEVLDALRGYTLLCTDRNGWIELSTDGEQMWVEVEK
jgi:competence protein ComEC